MSERWHGEIHFGGQVIHLENVDEGEYVSLIDTIASATDIGDILRGTLPPWVVVSYDDRFARSSFPFDRSLKYEATDATGFRSGAMAGVAGAPLYLSRDGDRSQYSLSPLSHIKQADEEIEWMVIEWTGSHWLLRTKLLGLSPFTSMIVVRVDSGDPSIDAYRATGDLRDPMIHAVSVNVVRKRVGQVIRVFGGWTAEVGLTGMVMPYSFYSLPQYQPGVLIQGRDQGGEDVLREFRVYHMVEHEPVLPGAIPGGGDLLIDVDDFQGIVTTLPMVVEGKVRQRWDDDQERFVDVQDDEPDMFYLYDHVTRLWAQRWGPFASANGWGVPTGDDQGFGSPDEGTNL